MKLTRGRGPFPTVMARVEVPSDMKQEREIYIRELGPLQIFLTTRFEYQGNAMLDIKIRPFLDRKEQLHLSSLWQI